MRPLKISDIMRLNHKAVLTQKPVSQFIYQGICLHSRTLRLVVENEEPWLNHLNQGGRVLLCTWHQQFFSVIRYFRKYQSYHPHLMISPSKDGDIIAGVARLAGWHPIRGSSSRDGKKAMRDLVRRLKKTNLAAHIVDGPRGPIGKVKAGTIRLAHITKAVIVPFYVSTASAWTFNSWDRFFIPKPFATVFLRFGKMVTFRTTENNEDFESQRRHLEKIMQPELRT